MLTPEFAALQSMLYALMLLVLAIVGSLAILGGCVYAAYVSRSAPRD